MEGNGNGQDLHVGQRRMEHLIMQGTDIVWHLPQLWRRGLGRSKNQNQKLTVISLIFCFGP